MVQVQTILSARRAYQYAVDDIKLTLLCHGEVLEHIRNHLSFEQAEIMQPPETFGPVPVTSPPGLVLAGGLVPDQGTKVGTIRMIAVDARRLVIEVAGPSSEITTVFESLMAFLNTLEASDGGRAFGIPEKVMDYSDLSYRSSSPLTKMFNPDVLKIIRKYGDSQREGQDAELIPALNAKFQNRSREYVGGYDPRTFSIDMRGGDTFEHSLLYSGAPLDTSEHIDMLNEMERALS